MFGHGGACAVLLLHLERVLASSELLALELAAVLHEGFPDFEGPVFDVEEDLDFAHACFLSPALDHALAEVAVEYEEARVIGLGFRVCVFVEVSLCVHVCALEILDVLLVHG